jgi:hypothetical protein
MIHVCVVEIGQVLGQVYYVPIVERLYGSSSTCAIVEALVSEAEVLKL